MQFVQFADCSFRKYSIAGDVIEMFGMKVALKDRWRAFRSRPWLSLSFDVLVIAVFFWAVHAWNTRDLPRDEPMPALRLPQLDGDGRRAELSGTGAGVVYFFAPWCFYCRNSIDNLDDLAIVDDTNFRLGNNGVDPLEGRLNRLARR